MQKKNLPRKLQEGDLVYLQAVDYSGIVGQKSLLEMDPLAYSEGEDDNYQTQLVKTDPNHATHKSPNNFVLKCLFSIDNVAEGQEMGSIVRYGTQVRFIHYYTNQALTASQKKVEIKENAYFSCFSDKKNCGSYQNWTITPCYMFRQEGECIFEDDIIQLQSSQKGIGGLSYDELTEKQAKIPDFTEQLYTTSKCKNFRIKIFRKFETLHNEEIYPGDVIQLQNAYYKAYLAAQNASYQICCINHEVEKLNTFKVGLVKTKKDVPNPLTFWIITLEDGYRCEPIQVLHKIKLINLYSGQFLELPDEIKEELPLILKTDQQEKTFIRAEKIITEKTYNSGNSLVNDAAIRIKFHQNESTLYASVNQNGKGPWDSCLSFVLKSEDVFMVIKNSNGIDQFYKYIYEKKVLSSLLLALKQREQHVSAQLIKVSKSVCKGLMSDLMKGVRNYKLKMDQIHDLYTQYKVSSVVQQQLRLQDIYALAIQCLMQISVRILNVSSGQMKVEKFDQEDKGYFERINSLGALLNYLSSFLIRDNMPAILDLLQTKDMYKNLLMRTGMSEMIVTQILDRQKGKHASEQIFAVTINNWKTMLVQDIFKTKFKAILDLPMINIKDVVTFKDLKGLNDYIFELIQKFDNNKKLPSRFISLWSLMCSPGGSVNQALQSDILQLIIGKVQNNWKPHNSVFLLKYKQEIVDEKLEFFISLHLNGQRPAEPNQTEPGASFDQKFQTFDKEWASFDEFYQYNKEPHTELQIYQRAQLDLFINVCLNQNREGQDAVATLVSPELIFHVLNLQSVSNKDKILWLQLLKTLYVQHYTCNVVNEIGPLKCIWADISSKAVPNLFKADEGKLFNLENFEVMNNASSLLWKSLLKQNEEIQKEVRMVLQRRVTLYNYFISRLKNLNFKYDQSFEELEFAKVIIEFIHFLYLQGFFDDQYNQNMLTALKEIDPQAEQQPQFQKVYLIQPGSPYDKQMFIKNMRQFLSCIIIQANPRFTSGETDEKEKASINDIYSSKSSQHKASAQAITEALRFMNTLYNSNVINTGQAFWQIIKKMIFMFVLNVTDKERKKQLDKSEELGQVKIDLDLKKVRNILQFPTQLEVKDLQKNQKRIAKQDNQIQAILSNFFGNLRNPEQDSLVNVLLDLLNYKDQELQKQIMVAVGNHFQQLLRMGNAIRDGVLLLDEIAVNNVKRIKQLQNDFLYYANGSELTENKQHLKLLVRILKNTRKKNKKNPGLADLCYASDNYNKCVGCFRWYRDDKKAEECCKQTPKSKNIESSEMLGMHQEQLRILKVGTMVQQFLVENSSSGFFNNYLEDKWKLRVFQSAYEFLTYFVLARPENQESLTQGDFIKIVFKHIQIPQLQSQALKFATELIRFNDAANKLISEQMIQDLEKVLIDNFKDQEEKAWEQKQYPVEILDLLKVLTVSDKGIQSYQITAIVKLLDGFLKSNSNYDEQLLFLQPDLRQQEETEQQEKEDKKEGEQPQEGQNMIEKAEEKKEEQQEKQQGEKQEEKKEEVEQVEGETGAQEQKQEEIAQDKKEKPKLYMSEKLEKLDTEAIPKPGSQLDFHLNIIDVLGTMTLGSEDMVEKFCTSKFNGNYIINMALSAKKMYIRQVFIRYMHGVFFSEGDEGEDFEKKEPSEELSFLLQKKCSQFIEMLKMINNDLELLTRLFNEGIQDQTKAYSYYVFEIVLPFLSQFHREKNLERNQTKNKVNEPVQQEILNQYSLLIKNILILSNFRQSRCYCTRVRAIIGFFTEFINCQTLFKQQIVMDVMEVTKKRDELKSLKCEDTEDILTLNSLQLSNFIKNVCLPKVLETIVMKVQENLLQNNPLKEQIQKEIDLIKNELDIQQIPYEQFIFIKLVEKEIRQVMQGEKAQEETTELKQELVQNDLLNSLTQSKIISPENIMKAALTQRPLFGMKQNEIQIFEKQDYKQYTESGKIVIANIFDQCWLSYKEHPTIVQL